MKHTLSLHLLLASASLSLTAAAAGATTVPATPPAAATLVQTAAQKEGAAHYDRGVELYQTADYPLALAEFERAYELTRNYKILYNIGNVQFQLAAYGRARVAFESYLAEGGAEIPSARLAQVRKDLADLAIRTAKVTLIVEPAGSEIRIDGHPVGVSPLAMPELVDGGTRRVVVSKTGYSSAEQDVRVVGGDERTVKITLTKVVVAPPVVARSNNLWIGWVATGTLGAATIVSGVLWAGADTKLTELKNSASSPLERSDQARAVNTYFWTTAILGGATLVAAGTTTYFALSSSSSSDNKAATLRLSPVLGGLRLDGTF